MKLSLPIEPVSFYPPEKCPEQTMAVTIYLLTELDSTEAEAAAMIGLRTLELCILRMQLSKSPQRAYV